MQYGDLSTAIRAYREGKNIMAALREALGELANNDHIVEIAYDLQSGSYVDDLKANPNQWMAYSLELASIVEPFVQVNSRVLDVGTGEMTTLSGVAPLAFSKASKIYAFDISFSRIFTGINFTSEKLEEKLREKLRPFVGNLFSLPLLDGSIDVTWTSHAIEPNGGKEEMALKELFRVSRSHVILFEPSYEHNSVEGRERMEVLGYVKKLPEAIEAAGGELVDVIPLKHASNPLNPTHAYVCKVRNTARVSPSSSVWACPATKLPMHKLGDCYFSASSRLAYPIINGVPILRAEQGVLASSLESLD